MMEEVLALRRIRPGSLSYGRDAARDRGYLEVARLAMLRRAQKQGRLGLMAEIRRIGRRFPDYGWSWPTGGLDQLLKAALLPDEEAAGR